MGIERATVPQLYGPETRWLLVAGIIGGIVDWLNVPAERPRPASPCGARARAAPSKARSASGPRTHVRGHLQPGAMPVSQLEVLSRLTGTRYPETGYPTGGWGRETNAWDAAEYCRKLISEISAVPSEAATEALKRLRPLLNWHRITPI